MKHKKFFLPLAGTRVLTQPWHSLNHKPRQTALTDPFLYLLASQNPISYDAIPGLVWGLPGTSAGGTGRSHLPSA